MRLKNSTDFSDRFLRRMVSWVAKQLALPVRKIRAAQFTKFSDGYRGRAWSSMRILCRVGSAARFPLKPDTREGMGGEVIADRLEALVAITAHELQHLWQYSTGAIWKVKRLRITEPATRAVEVRVLREFRANRAALLAEWECYEVRPLAELKIKPTIQEQRAAKVQAMLDKWTRKAKLAATKIKKLKRQARYYEQAIAATKSSHA